MGRPSNWKARHNTDGWIFSILALEKPNHLSSTERHQYYMFQVSFIHGLKVFSMLWYVLDMHAENVTNKSRHFPISLQRPPSMPTLVTQCCHSVLFLIPLTSMYNSVELLQVKGIHYSERWIQNTVLIWATLSDSYWNMAFLVEWPIYIFQTFIRLGYCQTMLLFWPDCFAN